MNTAQMPSLKFLEVAFQVQISFSKHVVFIYLDYIFW